MTTKDSSVTPIEVLRDITLTDLKDNATFKANTIWLNGPALILVGEYMNWGSTKLNLFVTKYTINIIILYTKFVDLVVNYVEKKP